MGGGKKRGLLLACHAWELAPTAAFTRPLLSIICVSSVCGLRHRTQVMMTMKEYGDGPARLLISPASNRVRRHLLLPSRHRLHACSPAPPCPHAPLHSKSAGRKPKAQHACLGLHIRLGFYAIYHGFAFPVPLVWPSRVHAHKRPSGLSHYYRKGRVCFSQNQLIPCVCAPLGSSTVLQAQRRHAHSTFSTLPRHPSGGPETT